MWPIHPPKIKTGNKSVDGRYPPELDLGVYNSRGGPLYFWVPRSAAETGCKTLSSKMQNDGIQTS